MGAEVFWCENSGKNAEEAFDKAVEDACYYHGHGGYTGTIAEKGGFRVFEAPKGMSAEKFMQLIENASCDQFEGVSPEHKQLVINAAAIFDDKWGPAVCVPLAGKELAEAKKKYCEANHIKRTSRKFFLFGGWASS